MKKKKKDTSEKLVDLYCPVCSSLMKDVTLKIEGVEYPEKQCPKCLTIYSLASESPTGIKEARDIILIPRSKKWLRKNGKKYLGVLPKSW